MSEVLARYEHLIKSAQIYGTIKGVGYLLEEIRAEACDSHEKIPEVSEEWIKKVRHELEHSPNFQEKDAVAVLQYVREQYLEELPTGADLDIGLSDENQDWLSQAVAGTLVGPVSCTFP